MTTFDTAPTILVDPSAEQAADAHTRAPRRPGWVRRLVRGRQDDPAWVRPALLFLLAATAFLYLWDLGASGWANAFYAAAVQAGTKSWKAFFFGSFDPSNFITVDKPPASLWVMGLSARLFGFNAWSILVPQALEGVAAVGVVYATVRRWFSPAAALLAGAVLALTPVAALMFRFDNPDALLVLVLSLAAYATVRALERGATRWLVLAGALVGVGFITKMLQALLVVPVLAGVYLLAGGAPLRRRLVQLCYAGLALLVSAGWWVAAVQLTPAADRPYIGGSQDNNLLNLVFGYNGFGRLTGNEAGSVGGAPRGSPWGPTGLTRLFQADMGGQISWLIPAALVLAIGVLWLRRRTPRTDRKRAAMLLWGGWLLVTGAVFSFAQGIIHPYYTVALAPAVAAMVGMGTVQLWQHRSATGPRLLLALAVAVTAVWSFVLLDRTPTWLPALRTAVLAGGLVVAAGIALLPRLGPPPAARRVALALGAGGLAAGLAGPLAYSVATAVTPHSGAIPTAGPSVVAAGLRPGGRFVGGGAPPTGAFGSGRGAPTGGLAGGAQGFGGRGPGFAGPGSPQGRGGLPFGGGRPGAGPAGTGRPGGPTGAGGLLRRSNPSPALIRLLQADASRYSWVAATVGANSAAGYQLGSGYAVLAVGGFNGTDPAPTLSQFQQLVGAGRIHYFLAATSPGGGPGGGPGGRSGSDAAAITSWVESHFSSATVGGVTVYDLSHRTG